MRTLIRNLVLKSASVMQFNDLALVLREKRANSPQVVVVEMHETLSIHAEQLRQQLNWVAKHFQFIDAKTFALALETKSRTWPSAKPAVLFTFDDGRESNYRVAAPILESFGGHGIFFVVPEFIGLSGDAAKDFYYSKIDVRNQARSADDEIWKPMTPGQLGDLSRRGHWIGNHTRSHVRLAGLSASKLQREVVDSSNQIAQWTGKPVEAFAWAYTWDAIDRNSWEMINKTHRLCFSPCPGTVDVVKDSSSLIWRKEIESYYLSAEYQFMYSGLVDPFWKKKRGRLRDLLK